MFRSGWRTSLRSRLTAWYTLLLGMTLLLFSGYLHIRLEQNLWGRVEPALLESISDRLLQEMLMALPLILVCATLGGLFLANRVLQPIAQMTYTAAEIIAGDLSRRINYRGVMDEAGQLAYIFDQMLNRIQATIDRERRFTADASHELRTPLTAIKGRIGMILTQPRTPEQYASACEQVEAQVDRLIRLTNDLLFLARIDEQRLPWNPTNLNLSHILASTVEQMRQLADEVKINLIEQIQPGLLIQGDSDYLIGIFLNLIDNAIKYTAIDGKVTVAASQDVDTIFITVSDSGTGIAPEHLSHLFERFYRVGSSRNRQTGGTGLGLSIAYEVIRLHGGYLSVQSQLQQGTVFQIQLPTKSVK
jgi:signal transduction histidine kinase